MYMTIVLYAIIPLPFCSFFFFFLYVQKNKIVNPSQV